MTSLESKARTQVLGFVEKYSIVIGALLIYGYYLVLTLDLFSWGGEPKELLGLVLQFDSLLLMWGALYVGVQLQKYQKQSREGREYQKTLLMRFQHQQLQLASLDDISDVLNDRINNPLSVISLSAGALRGKTRSDSELDPEVDKIETALKRIQEIMMGIQSYHTKKILNISRELLTEGGIDASLPNPRYGIERKAD